MDCASPSVPLDAVGMCWSCVSWGQVVSPVSPGVSPASSVLTGELERNVVSPWPVRGSMGRAAAADPS